MLIVASAITGILLALFNIKLLLIIVTRLLNPDYKKKLRLVGLLFLKLIVIGVVFYGAFVEYKVPAIPFVFGYFGVLVVRAVLTGLTKTKT